MFSPQKFCQNIVKWQNKTYRIKSQACLYLLKNVSPVQHLIWIFLFDYKAYINLHIIQKPMVSWNLLVPILRASRTNLLFSLSGSPGFTSHLKANIYKIVFCYHKSLYRIDYTPCQIHDTPDCFFQYQTKSPLHLLLHKTNASHTTQGNNFLEEEKIKSQTFTSHISNNTITKLYWTTDESQVNLKKAMRVWVLSWRPR